MAYDMSGVLGKNKYKKTENQPTYTGKCTINGEELRIAAWVKDGKDGKFFAMKFSRKDDAQKKDDPTPQSTPELDDEIPF
jgi:hypothetical protein